MKEKRFKSVEQRRLEKDLHSDKYRCKIQAPYNRKKDKKMKSWFDDEKEIEVDFSEYDGEAIIFRTECGYSVKVLVPENGEEYANGPN